MTVSKASLSKVQYTTPIPDLPDAPTIDSVTNIGTNRAFNNAAANVAFTAVPTGGTPATYNVTSSPGGYTGSGTSSPVTVTGLQSNTSYTFSTSATNATGTGASGPQSSSVTVTSVPQAPTLNTPTALNTTAVSLPFTAGADGGSSITGYTITSSPSIALTYSGTSSPFTITGSYVSGTEYTFDVTAQNALGSSSAATSSAITPAPTYNLNVDFLVIAGGGGANDAAGDGGGAGGYRTSYSTSGKNSAAESKVEITSGTNYSVTIGAGGNGGNWNYGSPSASTSGSNSSFATKTSTGGGKSGANGGSGGGNGGKGTADQGFDGGTSRVNTFNQGGAGGGGAGGAGGSASLVFGGEPSPQGVSLGARGNGLASSITGSSVTRSIGGSGGGQTGAGQSGGGANTGGGGAGGGATNSGGGGGGSGVVILRFDKTKPITVGAGLTSTQNTDGDSTVVTINAGTGNVSWS